MKQLANISWCIVCAFIGYCGGSFYADALRSYAKAESAIITGTEALTITTAPICGAVIGIMIFLLIKYQDK